MQRCVEPRQALAHTSACQTDMVRWRRRAALSVCRGRTWFATYGGERGPIALVTCVAVFERRGTVPTAGLDRLQLLHCGRVRKGRWVHSDPIMAEA